MGGFRDETETLRARVAVLEREVEQKNDTIERLTGAAPQTADSDVARETRSPITGGPQSLHQERILDFEVSDAGFEAIADLLRARSRREVRQVGRTLMGPGFSLREQDGRTHIALTTDLSGLGAAAISAGVLGGGFSAFVLFALVHDMFLRTLAEGHILWFGPLMVMLVFALVRAPLRRKGERGVTEARGLFEALVEVATRHRKAPPTGVRVEVDAPAEEAVEEVSVVEATADRKRA